MPAKFYGITRKSIKPALDDSAFELEEETKKEREARMEREKEIQRREDQGRGEDSLAEEAEDLAEDERRQRRKEKSQRLWLPVI